jgi:hypothetical protein
MRFEFTRARVIEMTRLHHALFTLSTLYFGEAGGTWHGTSKLGWYAYGNGCGDRFDFAWNPRGFVGLVFDHESERSQYNIDEDERTPFRWLRGITGPAKALAVATAVGFENNVTAGMWTTGTKLTLSDPVTSPRAIHGMELVAGFGLSPAEAVFGKTLRQNWLELSSLGETHARIAIRLAGARSTEVTAAEQDQLLELPDGCQTISLSDAQQVKEGLASLGVRWSVPRKRILALHAAKRAADKARIESALSADERALFEAARANNRRKIGALLAAGVNVEVRTVDGQWAYTPAGDTPLIQACKAKSRSAALALISSGADPNAHNKFKQTGLLWAVRQGMRDVVKACLDAGGNPDLADWHDEAPLLWAAQAGDTAMVERLIAGGATINRRTRSGVTAGERAGMHGHHALAKRLS